MKLDGGEVVLFRRRRFTYGNILVMP